MEQNLCSREFQDFYNQLQNHSISTEELLQEMRKCISPITEKVSVGKLTVVLTNPSSVLDLHGGVQTFALYENARGWDNTPYKKEFRATDGGKVAFAFFPCKGVQWTENDLRTLQFLAQNFYVLLGRSRMIEMMQRLTITDVLTGAVNTRGFVQFGTDLFERGLLKQYTGAFLNIKNFNYINQTAGAQNGDVILQQYVYAILDFLDEEEIVGRMGGDNFMVLLKNEHVDAFLKWISPIQITVPMQEHSRTFEIRARIGLCAGTEVSDVGKLMDALAIALNMSKDLNSGNCAWFQKDMLDQALHSKEVSLIFPKALENEEFVVYYQPKVTLSNNQLCGCEALVRWIRNGKLVPPMEFIPILEREGTVCELDFYVFEHVCQDIQRWLSKGIEPVRVSVNFSKNHLHNTHLAQEIIALMQKYQIDSKYIEVELTEMSGYENYATLVSFVQNMRKNGVSTSIDDFGTGYSSLNLLKDLDVDIIKLDKSFLNNLENHSQSDVIVIKNIVNMVNELHMSVIAEGVETQSQAEFLRKIHCRMAQGFLFDRPLPHDDFEKRLSDRHTYTFSAG